jgi:hypothetical protein
MMNPVTLLQNIPLQLLKLKRCRKRGGCVSIWVGE